ncbi:thiamine/thiamine pyrophosphate ABC transporter permease [Candidatus Curculioniphilus buchneri]|uniref:thiamine/thiamine pyrophosphate ABC transporter permease n=1 Tax=Candidatus Curculioniphilus buchneri TaxID=690594 RepID=UPI00376EEA1A
MRLFLTKIRCKYFPYWLWPGILASTLIIFIIFSIFVAILYQAQSHQFISILADRYLWHVLLFTFTQALISALLSTLPAILVAQALYHRDFPGRTFLLRFCSMTLVLPVLVGVFGIMSVFGQQGWLAQLCHGLHLTYNVSLYGLNGIVLAHVFFNFPLATRLLLQALESISIEQRRLAIQLGMSASSFFRLVEWPCLRYNLLPSVILIFILCFSSFSIVLILGGGPRTTTLAVIIYQSLRYDFDMSRAALLALLQMMCSIGFAIVSQRLTEKFPIGVSYYTSQFDQKYAIQGRLGDNLVICLALLFLIPPLLAVIINGLNNNFLTVIRNIELWKAIFTSLYVALGSGVLCLILTGMLLWSSRELRLRQYKLSAQLLNLSGVAILSIPSIILSTGLFLLSTKYSRLLTSPILVVILTNALMAIPYALKILEGSMQNIAERYHKLCLSLNIGGFNRLCLIERRALQQSVGQTLAFASILSLGDFGSIALFGDENFRTLPLYLYQQIGSYHNQDSAVTALLLLTLCFLLFSILEKCSKIHDHSG